MRELTLLEPTMLALAIGSATLAGFVRGFSGFGGPAVMSLILTQFYTPASVLPKVILIDVVSNVKLLPSTVSEVDWRTAAIITGGSLVGAPLGMVALIEVDPLVMKRIIALVVALCAALMLLGLRFSRVPSAPVYAAVGVVAGAVLGATYIALVMVAFLLSLPASAAATRANAIYWGFGTAVLLIGAHAVIGNISLSDLWRSAMVGVVYLGAASVGSWLFRRTGERSFRRAVICLLMVLAGIGLAT